MNRISIRMELGENNRTKYGQYFMALFAKLNQDLSWHYTTDSYQCKLMPKGNLSETKKTTVITLSEEVQFSIHGYNLNCLQRE